jgi:hypothetical protein
MEGLRIGGFEERMERGEEEDARDECRRRHKIATNT